jgi:hypothetical protein
VKLRIDAVDEHGKVVASTDTYNEAPRPSRSRT